MPHANAKSLPRRRFLGAAATISLAPALGCRTMAPAAGAPRDTAKKNILHITVEDWSSFALGCYGNPIVKTPHVDALARRGLRFDRAYCQSPVCNPSRASFCTGLRPDSTKVYGNGHAMDDHAPEGVPFIADALKRNGATTAQIGKLVHRWDAARRFAHGFDRIEYALDYDCPGPDFRGIAQRLPAGPSGPVDPELEFEYLADRAVAERLKGLREEREAKKAAGVPDTWDLRKPFQQLYAEQVGDSGLSEEDMEDGRIARRAAALLHDFAGKNEQFYLTVGLYATHTPLLAPRKYIEMYDPDAMPLTAAPRGKDRDIPRVAIRNGDNYDIFNGMYPEYAPTPPRQRQAVAAYYACASYIDAQIGLILDALKRTGLDKNTIVIFFSDHGFHLGEHGCWSKFTLFEQSTRVPLIVAIPGMTTAGRSCDEIVELVDVLPTMCDLWDLPKSPQFEGTSFTPLLENPQRPWKRAAFFMITLGGLGRSVRTKRHRYAEYRRSTALPASGEKPHAVELYDLARDPLEQRNLAASPAHSETVRKLAALLRQGHGAVQPGLS
jgi:uncharacterized sulfatase